MSTPDIYFLNGRNSASAMRRIRRYLLTSVAATIITAGALSSSAANEWTGAVNNDFFNNANWDDSAGPQGWGSVIQHGSASGTLDMGATPIPPLAEKIGTIAGADASLSLKVIDSNNIPTSGFLNFGSELEIGTDQLQTGTGGKGRLTIDSQARGVFELQPTGVKIGTGAGAEGELNLLGVGKNTSVPPEGPIELPYLCTTNCGTHYSFHPSSGIAVGKDGGTGTLNIAHSSVSFEDREKFDVGKGAGSHGTINVLAGGKLSDAVYGTTSYADALKVGADGGTGIINIDGTGAADRTEVPAANFAYGLTVGENTGSQGSVNVLAGGWAHSYALTPNDKNTSDPITNSDDAAFIPYRTRFGVDGGTGTLTVDGEGSTWLQSGLHVNSYYGSGPVSSDAGRLYIGDSGTGTLTIANGGLVRIGTATHGVTIGPPNDNYALQDHVADGRLILGNEATGNATLNIGGTTGAAPTAAGRLMAKSLEFGDGTGQVRFNHTETDYVFDTFDDQFLNSPSRPSTLEIKGAGTVEAAAGRTILNQDHTQFTGKLRATNGVLQVNGNVSAAEADILAGGVLEGVGTVGRTINAGIIAPGATNAASTFGTLTVNGDYVAHNGRLALETVLGNDQSQTDRLIVTGNTSGHTTVTVSNIGGAGAQTVNGIEVVSVGGSSDGDFTLEGDYLFKGEQAVVGGAYAYQLYQGGVTDPNNGNWYLRSELRPIDPVDPVDPLYQAGVPVYEAYPQMLLGLNGLSALQQRVGRRYWDNAGNQIVAQGADAPAEQFAVPQEAGSATEDNGIWLSVEGSHNKVDPRSSTSRTDYSFDTMHLRAGIDGMLVENEQGRLIAALTAHYVHGSARIRSAFGDGDISTDGYGLGGTLTWYGEDGLYFDGQAQATWYKSDLSSRLAGTNLTNDNNGFGYAFSMEAGKRYGLDQNWSLTPQAQLTYSNVDFDSFDDVFGARVSLDRGGSLQGRMGLAAEYQNSWYGSNGMLARSNIYGIGNLYYEFLGGTKVDTAGVVFASSKQRLWGGLGFGGSYNWNNDKYSIYGEGSVNTSLKNFGDSYTYKGNVGIRAKW